MGNTYQTRQVVGNVGLPVSGGIIREEHLNSEFTQIISAFDSTNGHIHNGTDSPRITEIGSAGQIDTTTTALHPANATIDLGLNQANNRFRDAFLDGTVTALTALKSPKLVDTNARDIVILSPTSVAVNQLTVANAATGGDVTISSTGSDTNVSMVLTPKGSGLVKIAKDDLAIGGTAVTATAAELNILDGDVTSIGTTAVAGGDGIITSDNGTMRSTSVDTFDTYLSQTQKELTNKTLTSPVITTPQLNDSAADHKYIFAVSDLAANRTVTLPLLGGDDEFVFKDHTQTLTNKTLTTTNSINTGTGFVAIKNGGARSELRLYCESSNAHYLALQAPAHGTFGGNPTLTFPTPPQSGSDTLVSKTSTDTLTNKTVTSLKETAVTDTTATGTETLDLSASNIFMLTLTGNTTINVSNPPTDGSVLGFTIKIKNNASNPYSVTWNISGLKWQGGLAPAMTNSTNAIDVFTFFTQYVGSTQEYYGFTAAKNMA